MLHPKEQDLRCRLQVRWKSTGDIGVWERINIGVFLLWVIVLAFYCLGKNSNQSPELSYSGWTPSDFFNSSKFIRPTIVSDDNALVFHPSIPGTQA